MRHKLQIGGNNAFHGVTRTEFEEGEEIVFRVPFLTDCSTSVTSDDVRLERVYDSSTYDDIFRIVMPEHDVNINISSVSNMMRPPMSPDDNFMANFAGMSMFEMQQNAPQAPEVPEDSERPSKYCSSCGARLVSDTQKFCGECGAKLSV